MSTTAYAPLENPEANDFLRALPRLAAAHTVLIDDAPATQPATPARHSDAHAGAGAALAIMPFRLYERLLFRTLQADR